MQLHYVRYYLQHKSADEYLKTKALKSVENSLISKEIDEVLRNKKSCFQSAVDLNLESASSFMMKVVNARKNLYNVNMKRKRVVTKDSDTKKYIRELEERVELLEATIAFNEELKQRVNFRLKQQKKK
ncbi:hypothetical protein SAM46_03135 [Mycoplasmopsis verecunda]|nr:hypothetical protein [Mycoplasmopsis verecunda]WPB54455.1 hypothetical protein SAM46_03135 [Mycoplasmopsis verecunda]